METGELKSFSSVGECAEFLGVTAPAVYFAHRKKNKDIKGWRICRYAIGRSKMDVVCDRNVGYSTEGAAGIDLHADVDCVVTPFGTQIVPTGMRVKLPSGSCGLVKSRSGLMFKSNIVAGEGLIDEDYTGEIAVKLFNFSNVPFEVMEGDRIAQLVVLPYERVDLRNVDEIKADTARGENGFGSTGIK